MNEAYARSDISDSPFIWYKLFWYLFRFLYILGSILSITGRKTVPVCKLTYLIIPLYFSELLVSPEYIQVLWITHVIRSNYTDFDLCNQSLDLVNQAYSVTSQLLLQLTLVNI